VHTEKLKENSRDISIWWIIGFMASVSVGAVSTKDDGIDIGAYCSHRQDQRSTRNRGDKSR
jgi:hypothetical protein